ncbi:hypothetical protein CEUSTIGMA_g7608.t1 [Chlamydomonas eustigma]|uniref:F-box domain-containing protein n=1 Tax=Chlamydomonas eustigma TaxID=1157962 RepID=A0A250XBM5_9CHLO|nr:hypothetical protein CEUSTIGMA_g7608.t1 [Chlamydomonas eustigma]|eukprot:GAX80170.1 hypothetical protein CEUSTIGMA_g7608.t1 [Chlamydomonas eustigma]
MTLQLENLNDVDLGLRLDALLCVYESPTLFDRLSLPVFDILGLPPEILSSLVMFLGKNDLCSLRQSCKALYRSTDSCMQRLSLCTATTAFNSRSYVHLRPSWLQMVKHLKVFEPNNPRNLMHQPHKQQWVVQGCSPVCMWMGLFAPGLSNLETISFKNVPYLMEAFLYVISLCQNISCLEFTKSFYHEFNLEAFWGGLRNLIKLQSLKIQGWCLQAADVQGLESLTNLKHLHIKRSTNHPTGLRGLSLLTELKSLTLEEIDYRSTILQEFCGFSRLVNLESLRFITVGPLSDEIHALCTLSRLKTLEISNHYDEHLLDPIYLLLSSITSLESVTLSQYDLDDALLKHLAKQPNLKHLSMGRCSLTTTSLHLHCEDCQTSHHASSPSSSTFTVRPAVSQLPFSTPSTTTPLANLRSLSLRCLEVIQPYAAAAVAVPDTTMVQQEDLTPVLLPLSLAAPQLASLHLNPQFLPHYDSSIDKLAGYFSPELPLLHLTSLTSFAPLVAAPPLLPGCPMLTHLTLDSCYSHKYDVNVVEVWPAVQPLMMNPQLLQIPFQGMQVEAPELILPPGDNAMPEAPELILPLGDLVAPVDPDQSAVASDEVHAIAVEGDDMEGHDSMLEEEAVEGIQMLFQPPPHLHVAEAHAAEGVPDVSVVMDNVEEVVEAAGIDTTTVQQAQGMSLKYSGSTTCGPAWLQNLHVLSSLKSLELHGCQFMSVKDCMQLAQAMPKNISELILCDAPLINAEGLVTLGAACDSLRSLTVSHSISINFEGVTSVVKAFPYLQHFKLDCCSPITQHQCNGIMKRLILISRRCTDIRCVHSDTGKMQLHI